MNAKILLWPAAALLGMSSLSAQAVPTYLVEFNTNIDGTVDYIGFGDPVPANVDVSLFDQFSGMGTISAQISGAGSHSFDVYFDHDIGVMYPDNELGSTSGAAAAGQSFEIDSPFNDIWDNFHLSSLDNMNLSLLEDDVAMALGWDFTLAANEVADIVVEVSDILPTDPNLLVLGQHNGSTVQDIFAWSTLNISCVTSCGGQGGPGDDTGKVPEPSILMLMSLGLVGMVASRRRKKV